jgi:hypothetical protein
MDSALLRYTKAEDNVRRQLLQQRPRPFEVRTVLVTVGRGEEVETSEVNVSKEIGATLCYVDFLGGLVR